MRLDRGAWIIVWPGMLPGAPAKAPVLCRNGSWADEDHAGDRRDQWGPALFPNRAAADRMIQHMRRNRGYLPDRFRWKGNDQP